MNKLIFHKCSFKDIPILIEVGQRSYKQSYLHIWNDTGEFYIQKSFTEHVFKKDLANTNIVYYIIYNDDMAVGLIKINVNKALNGFLESEVLEIEKIYLAAESSGKGIGSASMNFIKEYALKLNKKLICLNVMTTSPALHFYTKLGYQGFKNYDLDYPNIKDGYRGMLQMKLHL